MLFLAYAPVLWTGHGLAWTFPLFGLCVMAAQLGVAPPSRPAVEKFLGVSLLGMLGLSTWAPGVRVVKDLGALKMVQGALTLAWVGSLLGWLPRAATWLVGVCVCEAYLLIPLVGPAWVGQLIALPVPLIPFGFFWGDPRFALVAAQFGVAIALAALAGGPRAGLVLLAVPGSLQLVNEGALQSLLALGLLGGLLAARAGRPLTAGLAVGLGLATHPPGALLTLPVALACALRPEWRSRYLPALGLAAALLIGGLITDWSLAPRWASGVLRPDLTGLAVTLAVVVATGRLWRSGSARDAVGGALLVEGAWAYLKFPADLGDCQLMAVIALTLAVLESR